MNPAVATALASLDEESRAVMKMFHTEGLSVVELLAELGGELALS